MNRPRVSNKSIKIFVLCYPHLGTLDNWMSVVNRANNLASHLNFTLIIPNLVITRNFHKDNAMVQIADDIFDTILIHIHGKKWIIHTSVFNSIAWYQNNRIILRLFDIFKRLINKRLFSYTLGWLLALLSNKINKKECVIEYEVLDKIISPTDILFYDIGVEGGPMVVDVLQLFKKSKKYSIPHGLSMLDTEKRKIPISDDLNNKNNIKIYVYAKFQSNYYNTRYKIDTNKIHAVGMPRHDKKWISTIQKHSSKLPRSFDSDNTIAILSRHVDFHILFDEKIRSLKNIKKIFIDKLGMKVAIKLHPNEKREKIFLGKKETTYENVFGLDNYGLTWIYSDLHMFALGKGKKLAISLNTGTVFDMIMMNIPCIEYIDKINNSRKCTGKSTQFVKYGFIEGASNYCELSNFVDRWLSNPDQISAASLDTYKKYFQVSNDISGKIAIEILRENNIIKTL